MDNITASEIAGFGVGTLLLCATIAAPKIDAFISSSQRISLGMCKRCGNLKMIACKKCRGIGRIKEGLLFGFDVSSDADVSFGSKNSKVRSNRCVDCQGRGHFSCPDCAKSST